MSWLLLKMSSFLLTICVCILFSSISAQEPERKLYIAYMGYLPVGEYSPSLHHSQLIEQVVHPSFASKSLIRSYGISFNGFAAYLSKEEKLKLSRIPGIVSVFPSRKSRPQTTRSWDFMGLDRSIERRHVVESDTIVGVIDTGIWPESPSFTDEGYGPIPAKWKGICDGGDDFACNRKIIGARMFSIESKDSSVRDTDGHGTHVASIIAGNQVKDASYYGLAPGIARGGVPSARLAIYKVCNPNCADIDTLSAFDQAIADGVDIISISLNSREPKEATIDSIAIGAFHAIEKGILTVHSAGNDGPFVSSITSYAPWILTVGASDTDRKIVDKLLIGKDTILVGNAINPFPSSASTLPLVYGKEVTSSCSEIDARNCLPQCIDSSLVAQKAVLCDAVSTIMEVNISEALGYIYPNPIDFSTNFSPVMPYPTIILSSKDFNLVQIYKNSTIEPRIKIFKSEPINNTNAPFVEYFSSRGPSRFMPGLIKPDVVAPGVEILAAFSPISLSSGAKWEKNFGTYSILSGTSMACPHVAAATAFVKSFHPEWSPSAIKSALMTTAWEFDASLYPEGEFAYGSGQINPIRAKDPGLVYETSVKEYLKIWCNISRPRVVIPINASCPMRSSPIEINYPSMSTQVQVGVPFTVTFPRRVTNVGRANATYVASIKGDPSNLHFRVKPNSLQFTSLGDEMKFALIVKGNILDLQTVRVSLVWTDGVHRVRSPIVISAVYDEHIAPTSSPNVIDSPTPSSPVVVDTSNGERELTRSKFQVVYMLIFFIWMTLY